MHDADGGQAYLLWSNKHGGWWKHPRNGYTRDLDEAGRYSHDEARAHVAQSQLAGDPAQASLMVAEAAFQS